MTEWSSLEEFVDRHRRLFVLTGAGCSTSSGIPDYRDADGKWKRRQPVTYQAFMGEEATRRRYWARSLLGWRRICGARPNDAHRALARLEATGGMRASSDPERRPAPSGRRSSRVIDLHGRIDLVRCMGCEHTSGARRVPGRARPVERRLAGSRRRRCARRRRRPRKAPTFLLSPSRPAGAAAECSSPTSCFSARMFRATGSMRLSGISASRRHADRRLVADGLFGLPFRPMAAAPESRRPRSTSAGPAPMG